MKYSFLKRENYLVWILPAFSNFKNSNLSLSKQQNKSLEEVSIKIRIVSGDIILTTVTIIKSNYQIYAFQVEIPINNDNQLCTLVLFPQDFFPPQYMSGLSLSWDQLHTSAGIINNFRSNIFRYLKWKYQDIEINRNSKLGKGSQQHQFLIL